MAVVVAAVAVLGSLTVPPGSAGPSLDLVTARVEPFGQAVVAGSDLLDLRGAFDLSIGGETATNKELDEWTDTEIRFTVQRDPGEYAIALVPRVLPGSSIAVGTLTVEKFVLPVEGAEYVDGQISVRLAPGASPASVALGDDVIERTDPDAAAGQKMARWHSVIVPEGGENDRVLAYADDPAVEVAERMGVRQSDRAPGDPCYKFMACGNSQWNVRQARLTAAWEMQTAGTSIAILDSGVRIDHEDLVHTASSGLDFTGTGSQPCNNHGTLAAGVAAARANNGRGLAGAAWGANIRSYKVFGRQPNCGAAMADIVKGIRKAGEAGMSVSNMSFGGPGFSQTEADAIFDAHVMGTLHVASAGNLSSSTKQYPAAYNLVIAVGASNMDDGRAPFSNHGSWVDIAAPGVGIPTTDWSATNDYTATNGTSVAAPLVAGTAAPMRARGIAQGYVRNVLVDNADPVIWDTGAMKRLNAYRAMTVAGSQDCLRDVPNGAFVKNGSTVYRVDSDTWLRPVPPRVLTSWKADADVAPLCNQRKAEMTVSSTPWGYKPGSIVLWSGSYYLITTDGVPANRAFPQKRRFANSTVKQCMGYPAGSPTSGANASVLSLHPDGPDITSCVPNLREFANGTPVQSGSLRYVIHNGTKRPVTSAAAWSRWYHSHEIVSSNLIELLPYPDGPAWGHRPGRIIRPPGTLTTYRFATDDGNWGAGELRTFETILARVERGFGGVVVDTNQAGAEHPPGAAIRDADNQP